MAAQRGRVRLRRLGGGLRSWLGAQWTCAPALYLTSPPSCGGSAEHFRCASGRAVRAGRAGFSLFELILVLAIAGMMAALVLPYLPGAIESARFRGSAGEVRAVFNLARTLAVSEARNRAVAFDLDRGAYGIDGDSRKWLLPEGVRVSAVRLGDAAAERGVVRVRFYPDGSADEAEVAISSAGGGQKRIRVDPLTGMAGEGT